MSLAQPRGAGWWQQANVLRERLADAMPRIQVLWLTDANIDAAAHQAPDLWNWREAEFAFTASAVAAGPVPPGQRFDRLSGTAADVVKERLHAIESFLAGSDADDAASASLHLEAAQAYWRLGDWGRCVDHATQAALSFSRSGDESQAAQAKAIGADALHGQGQSQQGGSH